MLIRERSSPIASLSCAAEWSTRPGSVERCRSQRAGLPEYGQTLTREDGRFFFTVNGGTEILLRYELDGYAPSEPLEEPPVQDYDWYEDVVLAELDNAHDEIRLDGGATNAQAFEGSVVSDGDGPRSQTLIFPPGTEAEMELGRVRPRTSRKAPCV